MHAPIFNASSVPQGQAGWLPNMSGALETYMRPMTASRVITVGPNADTGFLPILQEESPTDFGGCFLPYPSRDLYMKPEKQRAWKWWRLYTNSDLCLKENDRVIVDGRKFTVMKDSDFYQAGFYKYSLVEGYQ